MHIPPPDLTLIDGVAVRLLRLLTERREPLFEDAAAALSLDDDAMWALMRRVSFGPNWLCERFRCRRCRFDARLRLLPQGEALLRMLDGGQEEGSEVRGATVPAAAPGAPLPSSVLPA